jgi:hypothetical protein
LYPKLSFSTSYFYRKDNRYTEKDAAVVVRRMLKVVAQCHLHGLVHRDMKPEVRSKPSRPHYFSNKNRMPIKRRLTFGPQIIDPYENDMHNPELSSLAIIEFRQIPIIRINDPMDAGLYIGDTCLAYGIRGLVFLLGREYHQVGNPVVRKLSNQSQRPIIIEDPSANQFLGYDALRNKYKVIRFMNLEDEEDEGTVIHCFTIGLEGISTHFVPTISPFL